MAVESFIYIDVPKVCELEVPFRRMVSDCASNFLPAAEELRQLFIKYHSLMWQSYPKEHPGMRASGRD